MVVTSPCRHLHQVALSVLALSSRFDGPRPMDCITSVVTLSVLALSSRFDGLYLYIVSDVTGRLSVLALSSRFDGPQC